MKITTDYDDVTDMVDGPYNPPKINSSYTEEDFEAEYEKFKSAAIACLESLGLSNAAGDYSVGHFSGPSRGLGVVLNAGRAYNKQTLERLHSFVSSFPVDYVLVLTGEIKLGEDFYICISKTRGVFAHADKKRTLSLFL